MYQRLHNKVALVTGASSGIGRAAAIAFAKEGAKVALASGNEKISLEPLRMVEEVGGEGILVKRTFRWPAMWRTPSRKRWKPTADSIAPLTTPVYLARPARCSSF